MFDECMNKRWGYPLVCWYMLNSQPSKEKPSNLCHLWHKYFHHGQFQALSVKSPESWEFIGAVFNTQFSHLVFRSLATSTRQLSNWTHLPPNCLENSALPPTLESSQCLSLILKTLAVNAMVPQQSLGEVKGLTPNRESIGNVGLGLREI